MDNGTDISSDARKASLARYGIIDTPDEQIFDEVAKLASSICGTPVALVTMLDGSRQWFKAAVGTALRETPTAISFCIHAVQQDEILIVTDASKDIRFRDNPLVTGDMGIRFYAGATMKDREGLPVGSVCVIDTEPRELTQHQQEMLAILARQASSLLEARLMAAERSREDERNRNIIESAVDYGIITTDRERVIESWNSGAERIFRWLPEEMVGKSIDLIFTEEDAAAGIPEMETNNALTYQRGIDERWHRRKDGSRFWASGEMLPLRSETGHIRGFVKILRDRTAQRLLEEQLRASQDTLKLAQEAGKVGTFSIDIATDRITMSSEFARIFGLTEGEATPIDQVQDAILPEDRTIASTAVERGHAGGAHSVEYRIRRQTDGEIRWISRQAQYTFQDGKPVKMYGVARDVTEQKSLEQQQEILTGEMAHRLKNTLAMVQAIASQTLKDVPDRTPVQAFQQRLLALNSAHTVLLRKDWGPAPFEAVVRGAIGALGVEERFRISGPAIDVASRAAMSLSLMVHELTTNAMKYGALSVSEGEVVLTWACRPVESVPILTLRWRETGGPPVQQPERKGFGSKLIAMGLSGSSKVEVHYAATGLEFTLTAALDELART